jgi:2-polyprenyl-6-methoxyphenol hydroxylase-like FAD-dependent oxidoreductase
MLFSDPEVLIAGAGPVGLFAALALARRELNVQIVDTGVWPCKHSYALALHPQTLKLLQEFGLAARVLQTAYPVRTIGLFDNASRRAQLHLDSSAFLAVVRQEAIEHILEKALQELGVHVSWRHELSAVTPERDSVSATVKKYEKDSRGYIVAHSEWVVAKTTSLDVPFLIGADGYNSIVRRTLDIGFPEVAPAQYYAVFEFKSDIDLQNEMRLVLGDSTTDVLWPLPDGHCRWSFQLPEYHDPEAERLKDHLLAAGFGYFPTERIKDRSPSTGAGHLPVLEEQQLYRLIAERAPWFTGKIENVSWRTVMRFERRLVPSYGQGRMWLAGDAAHLTGPAGIQSMNVGLFEANDLANALHSILRNAGSLDSLAAYSTRWNTEWRQLHGLDGGFKPQAGCDPWVRDHAAQLVSCLPGHGPEHVALAQQLKLQL